MTTLEKNDVEFPDNPTTAILELADCGKNYGNISALRGVSLAVRQGEVTCVLGDNGAGKSTLIKIISGLHDYSEGTMRVNGEVRHFSSPRESQASGIATVYQDLALAPLMAVWRNFFLGNELRHGVFRSLDIRQMKRICTEELTKMGIVIPDLDRPVSGLSGGQKQCLAIARAIYFGAKVIILDEPTAALGVKQSGVVLKYIVRARDAGLGVIFITHNPHHAHLVGNHFVILKLGRVVLDARRDELTLEQLTGEMAGGQELAELSHELRGFDPGRVVTAADADRTVQAPLSEQEVAATQRKVAALQQDADHDGTDGGSDTAAPPDRPERSD